MFQLIHDLSVNFLRNTKAREKIFAGREGAFILALPTVPLRRSDQIEAAIGQFEQALRLNPNLARAHLNLALTLESLGRSGEAAAHYEAARRLGLQLPPR